MRRNALRIGVVYANGTHMQEEFKANGEKVPWTCIMRDLLYCQESNFGLELEVYEEEIQKERKE